MDSRTEKRLEELERELAELRRAVKTTRTHGITYYVLLVVLLLFGFVIGYATHSIVGVAIIIVGLGIIAWREVTGFKAQTAVISHMIGEKLAEQRQLEERVKEFGREE